MFNKILLGYSLVFISYVLFQLAENLVRGTDESGIGFLMLLPIFFVVLKANRQEWKLTR